MGKEQNPKLCTMEKDMAKAKCGKHTEETHSVDHDEQQIVPQSSHTSNIGKQGSLLNDEANAPFTIGNGGINAGSMHDQEERTSPTSKMV